MTVIRDVYGSNSLLNINYKLLIQLTFVKMRLARRILQWNNLFGRVRHSGKNLVDNMMTFMLENNPE